MALATSDDVAEALGRDLTSDEANAVGWLLDSASDLIVGLCGTQILALVPVPDTVVRVAAGMAKRCLNIPASDPTVNSDQFVAGPYQQTTTFNPDARSGGPWLTKMDRIKLRPYRLGVFSVATW